MHRFRIFPQAIKLCFAMLFASAVFIGSAEDSQAAFMLSVTDTDNAVGTTITDNLAGDLLPGTSNIIIAFVDLTATGDWTFSGTVAQDPSGLITPPQIADINSIQAATSSGGTLVVELSGTDLTDLVGLANFISSIGGEGTGDFTSIEFEVYIDLNNGNFVQGQLVTDTGALFPAGDDTFAGSAAGTGNVDAAYSYTMVLTIICSGACTVSQNASFENDIPEPASLALFGIGLLMLGAIWRRPTGKIWPTRRPNAIG